MNYKKRRDKNGNDMYVIDLNKEGFDLDDYRKVQLIAYFHLLKLNFQGTTFNQISGDEEHMYIPYTFTLEEELALVSIHGMKLLYIEISEEEYIEIDFDQIRIVLEDEELVKTCIDMLRLVFAYDLVPEVDFLDFAEHKLEWQRVIAFEYKTAMKIGEEFIKNGYIICYPVEGDAFIVNSENELKAAKGKIEYLAIRSNVYENRSVLLCHQFQQAIMLGFFEHESEEIKKYLLTMKN